MTKLRFAECENSDLDLRIEWLGRSRDNDNHTFVVADGVGKGLGRIKNTRRSWRKMKRKLSEPLIDTSVTYAQYEALDQDGKLLKKRAPGAWTPSRYKGTRRAVVDLKEKTLIVYDLDYISHDQLDEIRMGLAPISRFAWFMHTTRSHTPDAPRARMILPVSRPMLPDEAHAVFRLLAQELADDPEEGIEIPDLVSFRGNQTMFWPSVSKDQEFWTDENVGQIVDVDEVLAANPGWEDFNNLPYQAEETSRGITDPNKRMEDPFKKPEPIGAFCRSYTVQEVIENWLTDIYAPGDSETEERYTYLLGTGSNGAVVYENGKFLHSNHGSDPVDTVNAFDLLRLHKFGHLDTEAHHNTTPGNMPSFKAAMEFARKDERVIEDLYGSHDETLDDLDDEDAAPDHVSRDDTSEADPEGEDDSDEEVDLGSKLDDLPDDDDAEEPAKPEEKSQTWRKHLRRKANGELENTLNNAALIVANDRRIASSVGYNDFTHDPVCLKPIRAPKIDLPSRAVPKRDRRLGRRWEDADDISIQLICSGDAERGGYECDMDRTKIESAVLARGMQNRIHPVKTFVEDCHAKWCDKGRPTEALDAWVSEYLGCPDTPFHRQAGRMLLIAAVARIYEPGCKFDVMPVIEGPTGSRKSSFWAKLFGGFVSELDCDLDKTDRVIEKLRGNWAVEMAEMAAAKKADSNMLKMRLSTARDTHRLAYAKREMEFPRQSIWVGTSNEDDYLTDPTSNRRFWVFRSPKDRFNPIDTDKLERNLWRLWGAAYQAYLDWREEQPYGDLWLDLHDHQVILEAHNIAEASRKATATEMIAESIREWLDTPIPAEDAFVDEDGMTLSGYENDRTLVIRNMVTPKEAYEALRNETHMMAYRNADPRTYGKALKLVPGWRDLGKVRRHGTNQAVWFCRDKDGPLYVAAQTHPDSEIDDLLG